MDRRRFLGMLARTAGATAATGITARAMAQQQPSRATGRLPNFIIVLTDDQGYQDLGCFGSPQIKTPRIDRMAAEGMKFTDFHVAAPVCTPSRAALLTGCYPQRVSLPSVLGPTATVGISDDELTIAQLLKPLGYATMCVGKWHLGHLPQFLPTRHGFDQYFGIPYSNDMGGDGRKQGRPPLPLIRDDKVIEAPVKIDNLTERYTDEAIKFIAANKDRPFFLYLPHTFPHVPLAAVAPFLGQSQRGLYGDVIECIDWSMGQLLDTLKQLGLDDNTLVVYTSDNGPWLSKKDLGGSALPLREGKGSTWEGGMRVPCVMRWPGRIPAGKVCNELALTMDLLPTIARLAGAAVPADRIIDGRDIWPLMAGEPSARTPHEAFFMYRGYALEAVRSGRWKLVFERSAGTRAKAGQPPAPGRKIPLALYDLEADISEKNNVAAANPEVVQRLQALAEKCRDDLGDTLTKRKGSNVRPAGKAASG